MGRATAILWIIIAIAAIVTFRTISNPTESVSLTYTVNANESGALVQELADQLAEYNATGTFYVAGAFAQENPEVIAALAARHEVGCMATSDVRLPELNRTTLESELRGCKETLHAHGVDAVSFRGPGRLVDERTYDVLETMNYTYDGTTYEHYGWLYPKTALNRTPTSSFILLPLDDRILMGWLGMGDLSYFMMRQDREKHVTLSLTPKNVDGHRRAYNYLLGTLIEQEVAFTQQRDLGENT